MKTEREKERKTKQKKVGTLKIYTNFGAIVILYLLVMHPKAFKFSYFIVEIGKRHHIIACTLTAFTLCDKGEKSSG